MLKLKNISKSFAKLQILNDISLEIPKAQIASITGASGAGKSTLLHIMGTLEEADQGELIINNQNAENLKSKQLADFRNKEIGFVFQFHHLLPEFSAIENVAMPALIAGQGKSNAMDKAMDLLKKLNIHARAEHKLHQMSGGEQQRVAIARALMNQPSVLLADEPSGNLDSKHSNELLDYLFMLRDEFNQTIVMVTHDNDMAQRCDIILNLKDGKINE
jgi:lipoprotein-releasing system ATP-binding protein